MQVKTRTVTVHNHYIDIDGQEFGTTFDANPYIDPKVETEGNKTVLTYAAQDEYPCNPRDTYAAGTMVRVRDGYNGIDIDQPDSDVAMAWTAASELVGATDNEIYYVVRCGCAWDGHTLEQAAAGECNYPYEALILGTDDQHFSDGSTYALEFMGGYEIDLDSIEGVAAMLAFWLDTRYATAADLAREYLKVARPDITAFIEWSFTGYSQGDWAEGYIYTTIEDFEDPEAALKAEVAEYASWANGDVYLLVQETYIDGEQTDYDCVGGFYGDDSIEAAIKDGGQF
jgi:hypothetical protein